MKKIYIIAAIVLLLGAGQASAEELKIGVINVPRILEQAPQAQAASAKLEKEFAPRNTEMVNAQRTLQAQEEKLGRDGDIMSDEERRNLEREIISGRRDIKRIQEEFRDDLNMRKQEELNKLQRQVMQAIVNIAKQDQYDLIVGEGVIYAAPKIDLTDRLLKDLERLGDQAPLAVEGKNNP